VFGGVPDPTRKDQPVPITKPLARTALAILTVTVLAQPSSKLNFEVASIKPSAPGSHEGGQVRILAGNQTVTASNVPLKYLLVIAYNLRVDQISGGPAWVTNDGYDLEAKASRPATRDELMQMLQTLLMERFSLTLRDDKKVQPVYTLVSEKAAPNLKHNNSTTELLFYPTGPGHYTGTNVPMSYLAWSLSRLADVGRVVIDRTGLTGGYDIDLKFTPSSPVPNAADAVTTDTGPSLFTALREQLGLKLESAREPVDYLTIERAERPSGN
jgi:uncharacterized protein (TIGR03435 family)